MCMIMNISTNFMTHLCMLKSNIVLTTQTSEVIVTTD
jgi:hypothetical protein